MEENQIELENVTKLFEKFKSTSEFVSSILDIPLPNELQQHDQDKEEEEPTNTVVEVVKSKSMNEDDLNGVWEDVKEKNFYTVIPLVGELIEAHPNTDEESRSSQSRDGERIQAFLQKWKTLTHTNWIN